MGTGGDAGSTNDTAATISQGSGTGYMGGTVDVYKIAVSSGQTLSVTMTPPSDANYDLTIRDSSVALDQSTNGVGQTESADTTAVSSGYLYIWVSKASVEEGDNHNYALTVTVTESSGATTTTTPAAVSVTNISSSVGQTISVAENGVTSITVTSATAMTVNFETAQPVKSISVTTSGAASSVSVQAEQLSAKPSAVTDPTTVDSGIIVSHYLDLSVTPTAATSVSVESATVEFKVTKSWLTANNIDPATVKLMRYSGGWTELSTSATTEDATYKYYSATTPGFSTFAVTGKAAAAAPSDSTMLIIAGAVILIVIIAAAVFVTKFRKP
jgi:PGF-pre-PGF domain-containing protein